MISRDAGAYRGQYVVGDGLDWPYKATSWQPLMTCFSRWVREVKDDLDTPDLWAGLQREASLLRGAYAEAGDNTPFTGQEREEIVWRLRELESEVAQTCTLQERQVEDFHAKIDYLVEAAGRVGRIDWLNLCLLPNHRRPARACTLHLPSPSEMPAGYRSPLWARLPEVANRVTLGG
jgi:hypothetical protein